MLVCNKIIMEAKTLTIICMLQVLGLVQTFPDWLVEDVDIPTQLLKNPRGNLRLTNGLIYREFLTTPDFATVDYYSYEKQSSLLRAIGPEAVISLDGHQYFIGGVLTNIPRAYLNRTALAQDMKYNSSVFHYAGYITTSPEAPFKYTPKRWAPKDIVWPLKGLRLDVTFKAPFNAPSLHQQVKVIVHYEMYDGIPLLVKWLSVQAPDAIKHKVLLSIDEVEYLSLNWPWAKRGYNWLLMEVNEPHGYRIDWMNDPEQPKMPGSFEPVVSCHYYLPPNLPLSEFSESFRVQELVHGSSDPERVGLAKRRKLRLLAPQTQENPIFFHLANTTSEYVFEVIDQMAEVGFEMLIYGYKCNNFNYESEDKQFIQEIANITAYARRKGIEVGAYDLIAWSRKVRSEWMAQTATKYHGACFASGWYDYLLEHILNFMEHTGMTVIETDGPYPGYGCHSTNHSHHHNYQDSIYKQQVLQEHFYKILQERGAYIIQPDRYFYFGGSKAAMGYNERQYSLPRWQDLSISRQGMFDDTFTRTPSIGMMYMPLVIYHGGGDAATFEPLSQHLTEYEWGLTQYLGAGVAACYSGYRLYDGDKTKEVVAKWVSFYKNYRDILNSDIIHVRRADMQSIDCYMHVNHKLVNKGLAMVFNPTQEHIQTNLTLPLYYTGLTATAKVSEQATTTKVHNLDRGYNIEIPIDLPALRITWFLIQ